MGISKYNESLKTIRLGEKSYSNCGTEAIIVEYENSKKVLVEFQDNYKYKYYTTYKNFKNCKMINPYDKNIYNVGFIGSGKYNSSKHKDIYFCWYNMIRRCYCENKPKDIASYENCSVCKEWHNFQNFANWYEDNYYECNDQIHLDKDIKNHGSKEYSPNNCLLVPRYINLMFIKESGSRGKYKIGVQKIKDRYCSFLTKDGVVNFLGSYSTEKDAFQAYKQEKEKYIQEVAKKYINDIPTQLYDALIKYEVLETD